MNVIQKVGVVPQYKKTSFKADNYQMAQVLGQDEYISRAMREQKNKEKKQKIQKSLITGLQVGALLSSIALAIFFIKPSLFRGGKGLGPSDEERSLGVKTKEELMKMFKDVKREKSFEELEMSGTLKEQLEKILDKMKRASIYKEYGLEVQNAYLFYGPPGTGKTTFINAICKKLGISPFVFNIGELKGGFQGTLEKNMDTSMITFLEAHRAARAKDPKHVSVFFFDECDEVVQKAIGANANSDNQICTRLKRNIDELKKEDGVYIFCNSNKSPDEIESAIASRLYSVYIERPNAEALMKNLIKRYEKNPKVADDLKTSSDKMRQFYEIMSRDHHEYAYREQGKYGWFLVEAPKDTKEKLCLNDFINAAIKSARELHLTDTEIEELKALLK